MANRASEAIVAHFANGSPQGTPHVKMRAFSGTDLAMDIERINQIGNTLSDLSSRTEALRRYL